MAPPSSLSVRHRSSVVEPQAGTTAVPWSERRACRRFDVFPRLFDIDRQTDEVDLVLGGRFSQLVTADQMRLVLAATGNPEMLPGTCEAAQG